MANYDTVKALIKTRMNALGYMESSQVFDFENASANEYGNRYILNCLSGENIENTIVDRFEDQQEWQILVAFKRTEHNDIIQLGAVHRAKDAIIKDLDKPANWEGSVKICKYDSWELIENPSYFIIDIKLLIVDEYIHG